MTADALRHFIRHSEVITSSVALAQFLGMSVGQVTRARKKIATLGLTSRNTAHLPDSVLEVLFERGHCYQPDWVEWARRAIVNHEPVSLLFKHYQESCPEGELRLGRNAFQILLEYRVQNLAPLHPTEVVTQTLETTWVAFYDDLITFKNTRGYTWSPRLMLVYEPHASRFHFQALQADTPRFWIRALKDALLGQPELPHRLSAPEESAFFQSLAPEWIAFLRYHRFKVVGAVNPPLVQAAVESHFKHVAKDLIRVLPQGGAYATIADINASLNERLQDVNTIHYFKRCQAPHDTPAGYFNESPLIPYEAGLERVRVSVAPDHHIVVNGYRYRLDYVTPHTVIDCYLDERKGSIRGFMGSEVEVLNEPYPPNAKERSDVVC